MKSMKLDAMFASIDETIRKTFSAFDKDIRKAFSSFDEAFKDGLDITTPGVETIHEEETRPDGSRIVRVIHRSVQVTQTTTTTTKTP